MAERKRRFGDRKDGYRLRHTQSFFAVMPHIMKRRSDAHVYFDDVIDIDELEKYVRRMRKEKDMPGFSLCHVIIAGLVRMMVEKPWLNRFVMGGKIFSRKNMTVSMVVKPQHAKDSSDVNIKPTFQKTDTVFDVYHRIYDTVMREGKNAEVSNSTDTAARVLNHCPAFIVRLFVNVMNLCDHLGLMTGFINKISPFHTSLFLTDVGSLGIGPIYHHLYDFGTTSIFVALGKKETILKKQPDGSVAEVRVVRLKFVLDERICDGFYFATAFRAFRRIMKHPECLEIAPAAILEDTWI